MTHRKTNRHCKGGLFRMCCQGNRKQSLARFGAVSSLPKIPVCKLRTRALIATLGTGMVLQSSRRSGKGEHGHHNYSFTPVVEGLALELGLGALPARLCTLAAQAKQNRPGECRASSVASAAFARPCSVPTPSWRSGAWTGHKSRFGSIIRGRRRPRLAGGSRTEERTPPPVHAHARPPRQDGRFWQDRVRAFRAWNFQCYRAKPWARQLRAKM